MKLVAVSNMPILYVVLRIKTIVVIGISQKYYHKKWLKKVRLIMQRKTIRAIAFLSVVFLVACGDDNASNGKNDTNSSSDESYASIDDLPNCTAKREGVSAFVEEDDATYICNDDDWVKVGTIYESVDDFPNCTEKRKDESVLEQSTGKTYICNGKSWEEDGVVAKPVESSSNEKTTSSSSISEKGSSDSKSSSSENLESSSSSVKSCSSVAPGEDSSDSKSSSSETPKSSSSVRSSSSLKSSSSIVSTSAGDITCGNLWCENIDVNHDVEIYTDEGEGGSSKITLLDNLDGEFFLGDGYEYPYAGIKMKWLRGDIADWGGICLVYRSTNKFAIELAVTNQAVVTEYNNYKAAVAMSANLTSVDFPWEKFKQETGWGKIVSQAKVLANVEAIQLKFSGSAGTSGTFFIQSMGRLGSCK